MALIRNFRELNVYKLDAAGNAKFFARSRGFPPKKRNRQMRSFDPPKSSPAGVLLVNPSVSSRLRPDENAAAGGGVRILPAMESNQVRLLN